MLDDVGNVEDGTVVGGDFGVIRHEEMSSRSAFGFWLAQIAGVAMDRLDHFTAVVGEDRIFLCGKIVEQLVGMCQSFFGWVRRLQSDGPYGCEDCAVNGSSVEEELAAHLLDEFLFRGVNDRSRGFLFSVLYSGSIFDCGVGGWLILHLRA